MVKIHFTNWHPGFQKVQFNLLLRERLNMSLSEAKAAVDAILLNEPVAVTLPNVEIANEFIILARTLGVEVKLE